MKRETLAWTGAAIYLVCALSAKHELCWPAYRDYGLQMRSCPDGRLRQTAHLEVSGVRRGAPGRVVFEASGHYTRGDADAVETVALPHVDKLALSLVDIHHATKPLAVAWERAGDAMAGALTLPDVPDGDYLVHAAYETRLGKGELDVALPLYTPARVHVITDRPLYEPGNVVKFRAVVLRARDLAPLDGRPGRWLVKDPQGDVLLEEKAPAADWGVVAGTFPLDRLAQSGQWHVSWVSADASDDVAFAVQPFTLPRFRVETEASKPFYLPGDAPRIRGSVLYSSGAPVANAKLTIEWYVTGAWPPPPDWKTKLTTRAVTGGNGRFELAVPPVPKDLQGKVTMTAQIGAVDPAGDRVEGSAIALLSQDGIEATAVTELGDGLVQGFNNRLYVRVTTPDGRAVTKSKVKIRRAWQPADPGSDAQLDEDGVAALQLDPGPPVNVVIPAPPWRPQPRPQLVSRGELEELIEPGSQAPLADQETIDKWLAGMSPCAKWTGEAGASEEGSDASGGVRVAMRVDAAGNIVAVGAGPSPLGQCVAAQVRAHHLPSGPQRLYAVTFSFGAPDLASVSATVESALPAPQGLQQKIELLARGARDCIPIASEGELPQLLTWHARAGSKEVELSGWIADPKGGDARGAAACIAGRMGSRVALAQAAETDSIGLVRFSVEPPAGAGAEARPQPTTMLGYELAVATDGGSTKLRVAPGQIPDLRLRIAPVLAQPGDAITAELIRGPGFTGELPKQLAMSCVKLAKPVEANLDPEHHAKLTMPADVEGWCEVTGGGARALVYARPKAELEVAVNANPRYAPGEVAQLAIETKLGGKGGRAAVGLFGVDASLGQLATLAGPDDMARVRPKVETGTPAFGVLDGQALALGRIRGANAAAATVLRVTAIPHAPDLDAVVAARADSAFDPVEELTDRFYIVLAELHAQARKWEAQAPAAERMHPAKLAELWKQALAACKARGERVDDAYGRELRLSRLPGDLLALTDPRAVIVVGTRLPEDVENWPAWVAKEKP